MYVQGQDTEMTTEGSPWWALYTRHQHEKTIAEMLSEKGFKVFLPLYESVRRWKDRRKVLSLPLFPGYVFMRGDRERRLGILSTPGVHMILSRGETEAVIPNEDVEAIRRSIESKFVLEPHPYLSCGDRVRVKRGALDGVEGILVRKKNLFRLVLSVQMLAQSVSMEIDAADVEPVRSQSQQTTWATQKSAPTERFPMAAARIPWRTPLEEKHPVVTTG